ncbi:MAG: VOC family protein [Zoogloea sp.]|uniref:VOC family protein n=1 Tax=Zoogloea sp. TaxID=49181 RepID=UPI003F3A763B|nr:VOC family protein [Rhodocyclales bacterium]
MQTMETLKPIINWFEIPVLDMARAVRFYEATLACSLRLEDMGATRLAVFPYAQPATGGALCAGPGFKPGLDGIVIYLDAGPDLAATLARAEAAGAEVLLPSMQISPEIGSIAWIKDSEGNRVGLHAHP